MILTVTPNAALDRLIFIEEFRPGTTMRASKMVDCVGGKALDASVTLCMLGAEALALSFVAGSVGQRLAAVLDNYGVRSDLVWLEGETRISHVLIETRHNRHSHVTAGVLPIPPQAVEELLARYRSHLHRAGWVATGGSLAPGLPVTFYRSLTEIAGQAQVPILIDGQGRPVLAALPAQPAILKMNWVEFSATFNMSASNLDELAGQVRTVREREELRALVVTCGEQGLLAFTPAGAYRATAPVQQAVNAAGAGDAASGALAWRLSLGESWPEAIRWTAAISAASVLTEGTAECRMEDVERLLPQTEVSSLS